MGESSPEILAVGPPSLSSPAVTLKDDAEVSALSAGDVEKPLVKPIRTKDFGFLPIPKRCRYDHANPPPFTMVMNVFFGSCATISIMNLYYAQPILVTLARDFNVTYNQASEIAVLSQAGYAVGLFFIASLGDLVPRRGLILILLSCTSTLTIGLALSRSLVTFEVLTFLISTCTVIPMMLISLTADLAPEHRRGSAISITLSGLVLGLLIGRVVSGLIANFASWRITYWLAVGLLYSSLGLCWAFLPDFPKKEIGMNYFQVLWSMITLIFKYPTLVQCMLIGFMSSSVFSGWWTCLTFLLSDAPYHYNSFEIGLFGLTGVVGVISAPLVGKLVDRLVPWVGQLFALFIQIAILAIGLGAAQKNAAVPAIICFALDVGLQLGQVTNFARVYSLNPSARARLGALQILAQFLGQTMGSGVQTRLYNDKGWRAASGFSVGCVGIAILILLARGPHAVKWVGWDGGADFRKESEKVGEPKNDVESGSEKKVIDVKPGKEEEDVEMTGRAELESQKRELDDVPAVVETLEMSAMAGNRL